MANKLQGLSIDKVVVTSGFALIAVALVIIAATPAAAGYEISIYNVYPPYFWGLIIAGASCGIFAIVRQAFYRDVSSRWWVAGFILVMFTTFILLLLPFFRGYLFYGRGDALHHVGYVRDIISTGHLGPDNFYPAAHVFFTSMHYITGIDPMTVIMFSPSLLSIFYILSVYLLARVISQNQWQVLFITAFGSTLMISTVSFSASIPPFFLLPIILLVYYRTRDPATSSVSTSFALILFLLFMPFLHPFETLFLIALFIVVDISIALYKRLGKENAPLVRSSVGLSLILFVTWFIWFSSFTFFESSVREVTNWLFYQAGQPPIETYGEMLAKARFSIPEFIEVFTRVHGAIMIYVITGGIVCILTVRYLFLRSREINQHQFVFVILYVFFGILTVAFFLGDFMVDFGRTLKYLVFASIFLNGMGTYLVVSKIKPQPKKGYLLKKYLPILTVMLILISTLTLNTYKLYFDPRLYEYNHQVTRFELNGVRWLIDRGVITYFVDDIIISSLIYGRALLGPNAGKDRLEYFRTGVESNPPDHFDYDYEETGDRYLIIDQLSRQYYQEVFPDREWLWKFTKADFDSLEYNHSMSKLYSNGEFDLYKVNGQ